jgi:FkbM family methyltransferase
MIFNFFRAILLFINYLFPLKSIKLKIYLRQLSENILHKRIGNKKFLFYIENYHCFKRYSTLMTKEKSTIVWLNRIKQNEVLWDIGANIGIYSLYAAKVRKANVFSFEPIINSARVLKKNIELNNLQQKIKLFTMGIGSENKIVKLYYTSNHAASARHQLKPINKKNLFEDIVVFTTDELLKNKILDFPNYVKIDTDGNEIEILKNSKKILSSKNLKSLCIENELGNGENLRKNEIIKILKKYGFAITHVENYILGYNMFFKKNIT